MRVSVGGKTFPSASALRTHCSQMLNSGALDHDFLLALLERHHEVDLKVGPGVKRFFVAPDGYGHRGFWIERIDGTRTDFSFNTCIKAPSAEVDAKKGFRTAVVSQVIAFRDNAYLMPGEVCCAITVAPVSKDDAHVDHAPPYTFNAIVAAFVAERGLVLAQIKVNATADGDTVTRLSDQALELDWQEYHRDRAKLRITSARANLSQGQGCSQERPR